MARVSHDSLCCSQSNYLAWYRTTICGSYGHRTRRKPLSYLICCADLTRVCLQTKFDWSAKRKGESLFRTPPAPAAPAEE
jgi:hypothetical protein